MSNEFTITGTQCELAHQSESELLALVDSYSFGSDRAVLNFVPSTCIVASTFEGRNWTSATNCRPTSCQWRRHWHAANTQNRWLSALPNTKYVEKQMIFEACLASLTWANFEDVFSKMQFLHSASSLLRHNTRCHHANKKKSSAQVHVFATKANVQKICVSLQRKLHFSCCCHWPHTLRSRGTSTPYVKRVYIHKNLHLEAWLTVYHWSASASKNEDWLKCDNGRFSTKEPAEHRQLQRSQLDSRAVITWNESTESDWWNEGQCHWRGARLISKGEKGFN